MAFKWTPQTERRMLTLLIAERGGRGDHLVKDSLDNQTRYVTGWSCTCPDFVQHGACVHHSFLLNSLGWDAAGADDDDLLRLSVFNNGRARLRWTDDGEARERWLPASRALAIWDELFADEAPAAMEMETVR